MLSKPGYFRQIHALNGLISPYQFIAMHALFFLLLNTFPLILISCCGPAKINDESTSCRCCCIELSQSMLRFSCSSFSLQGQGRYDVTKP